MAEQERKNWLLGLLCGAMMGGGAILPGVSGGVLCVVFGYYRPLMEILTHPPRGLRRYWRMFVPVLLGWVVGFFGFARLIDFVFDLSAMRATWAFIGLIIGTIPSLLRQAGREGRGVSAWISLGLCALAMGAGLYYVGHVAAVAVEPTFGWYTFCGCLWGLSIVIPGMTSASILIALGLYQHLAEGIARLDIVVMTAWIPGLVVTVAVLARLVSYLFRRYYAVAFHGVVGVVIASTVMIVPTSYRGPGDAAAAGLCFAAGFAVAFFLDRLEGSE